jgi:hypothetical protein
MHRIDDACAGYELENESLVRSALQKRKLENLELRLADETRAFRPENRNQ